MVKEKLGNSSNKLGDNSQNSSNDLGRGGEEESHKKTAKSKSDHRKNYWLIIFSYRLTNFAIFPETDEWILQVILRWIEEFCYFFLMVGWRILSFFFPPQTHHESLNICYAIDWQILCIIFPVTNDIIHIFLKLNDAIYDFFSSLIIKFRHIFLTNRRILNFYLVMAD